MLTPPYAAIAAAIAALHPGIQTATKYIDPKQIARATYMRKPDGRSRYQNLIVSYGAPNYRERQFIKLCKRSGEPFPVRKVQLKPWPKKRLKLKGSRCGQGVRHQVRMS